MTLQHTHWNALRRILLGESIRADEWSQELVHASVRGGVLRLAVEREPRLESWSTQELSRLVHQEILLEQADKDVSEALAGLEDRVLRLKGTASAYCLYPAPGLRERRDIDLLVTAREGLSVRERLSRSGWLTLPQQERPWWSKNAAARYEETMFKVFGGQRVEVDLHYRLCLYRHLGRSEKQLWARSTSREGVSFRLPSNEDLLLHTVLHAAASGFSVPLKSWFDVHLLCTKERLDWELLVRLAKDWKVPIACWAGLYIVKSWFGSPVPTATLHQLQPASPVHRSMRHLLSGRGETPLATGPFNEARRQVAKAFALGGNRPWELVAEQARLRMIPAE